MEQTPEMIFNVKGIAAHLGVNQRTVYGMVNQRAIPYFKIGDLIKFRLSDIERWITRKTVTNAPNRPTDC